VLAGEYTDQKEKGQAGWVKIWIQGTRRNDCSQKLREGQGNSPSSRLLVEMKMQLVEGASA